MTGRHPAKGAIGFSVSGMKHYEIDGYRNSPCSFAALSLTGGQCGCQCAHCGGSLLQGMADASTPEKLAACIDKAAGMGCTGVLVSGGSGLDGAVPVLPAMEGIAYAKSKGLKVLVHTGLADKATAAALKKANVDQALCDVIGSAKTIKGVYGLDKSPEDFYASMLCCVEAGIETAPHLVVGLDFGRIEGEYRAIDMVRRAGAKRFVLVVLAPRRGTQMAGVRPPLPEDVVKVFRYAADTLPGVQIALGCARPSIHAADLEKAAVDLGFGAIAYPRQSTVDYARGIGLAPYFFEECCSLVGNG